jgi:hypothetical protein
MSLPFISLLAMRLWPNPAQQKINARPSNAPDETALLFTAIGRAADGFALLRHPECDDLKDGYV